MGGNSMMHGWKEKKNRPPGMQFSFLPTRLKKIWQIDLSFDGKWHQQSRIFVVLMTPSKYQEQQHMTHLFCLLTTFPKEPTPTFFGVPLKKKPTQNFPRSHIWTLVFRRNTKKIFMTNHSWPPNFCRGLVVTPEKESRFSGDIPAYRGGGICQPLGALFRRPLGADSIALNGPRMYAG